MATFLATLLVKVNRKYFFILALALPAGILLAYQSGTKNEAIAGAEHNISGWTWSENTGWQNFNSADDNAPSDYGVNADTNGVLSGYAWFETIGWVSFNRRDLANCPDFQCEARIGNFGNVSGWARTCAGSVYGDCTGGPRTDGWDGWIHLRGPNYGLTVSGCNWDGWAWGSDVVGWIHFKGTNYGVKGASGSICSPVTVDLKANGSDGPISIPPNTAATLSWTSTNAVSCTASATPASGLWSGAKATSSVQITADLISSENYSLICTGPQGSGLDSVTVNVASLPPPPPPPPPLPPTPVPVPVGGSCTATKDCASGLICKSGVCGIPFEEVPPS